MRAHIWLVLLVAGSFTSMGGWSAEQSCDQLSATQTGSSSFDQSRRALLYCACSTASFWAEFEAGETGLWLGSELMPQQENDFILIPVLGPGRPFWMMGQSNRSFQIPLAELYLGRRYGISTGDHHLVFDPFGPYRSRFAQAKQNRDEALTQVKTVDGIRFGDAEFSDRFAKNLEGLTAEINLEAIQAIGKKLTDAQLKRLKELRIALNMAKQAQFSTLSRLHQTLDVLNQGEAKPRYVISTYKKSGKSDDNSTGVYEIIRDRNGTELDRRMIRGVGDRSFDGDFQQLEQDQQSLRRASRAWDRERNALGLDEKSANRLVQAENSRIRLAGVRLCSERLAKLENKTKAVQSYADRIQNVLQSFETTPAGDSGTQNPLVAPAH